MKKIIQTFFVTLLLVVLAGLAGLYVFSQKQPEKVRQFLGCPSSEQQELHQDVMRELNNFQDEIAAVRVQLQDIKAMLQDDTTSVTPVELDKIIEETREELAEVLGDETVASE